MNKTLILLLIPFVCFGQLKFLPESKGQLVNHTYYSLSYIEEHEQAEWVHYRLDSTMLKGCEPRKNSFKQDTKDSITSSSVDYNYKKYKYQRGHLIPAADMKLNPISMSESFYMSNISPQNSSFNKGKWLDLEKLIRAWANQNEVFITAGGVLNCGLDKITGGVSVPELYYKIIYDTNNEKMIGFLMPNKSIEGDLKSYVVSVEIIEAITNINFFPKLENSSQLESSVCLSDWNFDLIFKFPKCN